MDDLKIFKVYVNYGRAGEEPNVFKSELLSKTVADEYVQRAMGRGERSSGIVLVNTMENTAQIFRGSLDAFAAEGTWRQVASV